MQNKNNKNYRLPKKQNKTFFFIFHKTQIKGDRNFKEKKRKIQLETRKQTFKQ